MDLSDLRIFAAVVREGGVTRAAERLHRVQSNVTTRVRQLEEELGVDLFLREGKRLRLSPAGQILLPYAERLLALAEEAKGAVQDPRPRGVFRLGAMESTAAVRLPAPLTEYHRRHPGVVLELRTGNPQQLAAAILAGQIDAALVAEPIADAPFEKVLAFEEEAVIVAAADHPPIGPGWPAPRTMLAFEHLQRQDLHPELIPLARRPRLFALVVKFRDRLVQAGSITPHRLLWEYGKDTLGPQGARSFSEQEWREWLQTLARNVLDNARQF